MIENNNSNQLIKVTDLGMPLTPDKITISDQTSATKETVFINSQIVFKPINRSTVLYSPRE